MTAQDLKNSILQLAMQGKLAPQDPNDEPASELLKRIKAEKARLIKEGKIKKEKPSDPITEEEKSFEIPENWVWVRLSQIVYNFGQKIPDEEFCYIDVGSIDNNDGRLSETNTRIKPENAPSRARKVVMRGAILYSCVRPYLLNTCIVDRDFPRPPIASTAFAVLMPYEGIQNKYLHQYLRSPSFVAYTNITSTGQAYPAINDRRLYDAVIPVPPYEEQKRIVAKIEELLPLVERYDESEKRLLELNKKFPDELRKAILQQAVQGKLTEQDPHDEPASELLKKIKAEKIRLIKEGTIKKEKPLPPISEDEIPFDIPQGWKWVKLGELTSLITKGSSPNWQGYTYTDKQNGILFVTSENVGCKELLLVKKKYVSKEFNAAHPSSVLKFGDILTNIVGASIGRTAVFSEKINNANINQAVCLIRLINNSISDYLLNYMLSPQALVLMLHKTVDTARANLSLTSVANLLIPLPPVAEQARIVARAEELLSMCDNLQ